MTITPAYDLPFDWIGVFHHGLAAVRLGENYFHIKPDGSPAYAERFAWVGDFNSEGKALVSRHGDFAYGRINTDGKLA